MVKRFLVLPFLLAVGGFSASGPPPVAAADISLESRTFLPARGIDGGDTHAPLYEYLALDAYDLGGPGLYVRAGGWGRADLADETFGRTTNGQLQYAFLGWRAPVFNAEARLGRISLTSGVARNELFDGALVGTDLPAGFDVTLFGGVPVETDEGGRSKDSLYGGRLSQGMEGLYRLGVSYLREEDAGTKTREEAGVDVFVAPLPILDVTGSSLYNVEDDVFARHEYRATLGPLAERVRLIGAWVYTDYEHYFQAPANPVFAITTKEELNRISGELEFVLGGGFTLTGEYIQYDFQVEENVPAYGGRLDWAGQGVAAGAGYRLVDGDSDEGRYQEVSAHASTSRGPLTLAASGEYVAYKVAVNGKKDSTTGSVSIGYAVTPALEVSATGEYGVTPEFEREVTGVLAVTWRYDVSTTKGGAQ